MSDKSQGTAKSALSRTLIGLRASLTGPHVLAFLPAICLGAFWLGGQIALLYVALAVPLLFLALGIIDAREGSGSGSRSRGIGDRDDMTETVASYLEQTRTGTRQNCCFVIELDEFKAIEERFGRASADRILKAMGERIASTIRDADELARLDRFTFAVCTEPTRRFDLEAAINLAGRMQKAIEEPVSIDAMSVYVESSIGFCLSGRAPDETAEGMLEAAEAAMVEARRVGPSAIRAFTEEMRDRIAARHSLIEEVASALEKGDITPWFQPQISTDTGEVTGFEALARWAHPTRGLVSPAEFLPAVEQAGLMPTLGEKMLKDALTALKAWDKAGLNVPTVGVNFSPDELRNPKLVEKIKWELDRFEMPTRRLSIEILESVVATSDDDTITRNISALAELGCGIDLDDFGTGHASISSIRRFSVNRIKIDRSFVMKLDQDPEQQRMIAAILMMAERLDLETLAEGVETVGEHNLLAQLGCGHVQGYGIARPMPFDQTFDWLARHSDKISEPAKLTRKSV